MYAVKAHAINHRPEVIQNRSLFVILWPIGAGESRAPFDVRGSLCICSSDRLAALNVDLVAALRPARVMSRSLVECNRNVPMTMVTKPHTSVVACLGLCTSCKCTQQSTQPNISFSFEIQQQQCIWLEYQVGFSSKRRAGCSSPGKV